MILYVCASAIFVLAVLNCKSQSIYSLLITLHGLFNQVTVVHFYKKNKNDEEKKDMGLCITVMSEKKR